jgi:ATPase subunit of ABC transporter with duplicated ATPase domains
VTHDRYLVQKIATHLIYVEAGKAHVFDRLRAFEEWLAQGLTPGSAGEVYDRTDRARQTPPAGYTLSKNKRDQLEKEVRNLEKKIGSVEAEIAELELFFQNPATGTDWETTHKRYADLKLMLEGLYEQLASRWELMG